MKESILNKETALILSDLVEKLNIDPTEIKNHRKKEVRFLNHLRAINSAVNVILDDRVKELTNDHYTIDEFLGLIANVDGIGDATLNKIANGLLVDEIGD